MIQMNKVQEYLNRKLIDHQKALGIRITMKDEANHIGVGTSTYSSWINGYSFPEGENLRKIKTAYRDNGIYDAVGLEPPIEIDPIDSLPEPTRSIAREIRETVAEYNVPFDSPKALELQEEILKKYGFEIISKDNSSSEQ